MDSSSLIIGLILLLIITLPIVYLNNANKRKQKEILSYINKKCKEKGLQNQGYEIWNKSLLALDAAQNKLFYQRDYENLHTEKLIDLNQYFKCKLINNSKSVKSSNGNYQLIDKLALELLHKDPTKDSIKIKFYDSNKNFHLSNELELLSKWSKILNQRLQ